jgi:hypothetical protein
MDASLTSSGTSATFRPICVRWPSGPMTPSAINALKHRTMVSEGGKVSHSNFMRLSIPNALSWTIGEVRSVRRISGAVVCASRSKASLLYKR